MNSHNDARENGGLQSRSDILRTLEKLSKEEQDERFEQLSKEFHTESLKTTYYLDADELGQKLEEMDPEALSRRMDRLESGNHRAFSVTPSATPRVAVFDDPDVMLECRQHESEAREMLMLDNALPVCPVDVQYPYSEADAQRVPEEDRDGFLYFLRQDTQFPEVLSSQIRDWAEFRFHEMQEERRGKIFSGKVNLGNVDSWDYAKKRAEWYKGGGRPKKTLLEDIKSYQAYHRRRFVDIVKKLEKDERKIRERLDRKNWSYMQNIDFTEVKREKLFHKYIEQKIKALEASNTDGSEPVEQDAQIHMQSSTQIALQAVSPGNPEMTQPSKNDEPSISQGRPDLKRKRGRKTGKGETETAKQDPATTTPKRATRFRKSPEEPLYELDERGKQRAQRGDKRQPKRRRTEK